MAMMSMKMLAALQAAKAAGGVGLRETEAGWINDAQPEVRHAGPTVSALVERGELSRQRNLRAGSRCFLTNRGEQSLADSLRGMRGSL